MPASGNEIETIQRQRFDSDPSSAAGQGNLNGPGGVSVASRDYYSAMYYDAANRLTASADVGNNGGVAWTRPSSAPARSDTALVTSTGYAADNVQEVVINGNPTGGTFELKFNGTPTGNILWNATGLGVESALQSILGSANVMVTGPASGPYFIEFAGTLGGTSQPIMTVVNGLTGGTSPGLAVSTVQTGGDAGYAQSVTDPRGVLSVSDVDALGRTFRTVGNFTPGGLVSGASNQTTRWTFDGNNDTLSMTATSDEATYDGPDQTTAWVYGVGGTTGTNLFSNDLIHQIQYPDKTLGTPSPLAANDQTLAYDFLGEQTTFTDQNGTLHSYLRDVLGRLTADIVTTPGSGISQTVRRLGYAFDTAGRPFQQTSYSNVNGGASILNQVQDAYNGYGQLVDEYQNHLGAVNTSTTPKVVYGFAQPTGANFSRLTSMTYPNGRTVDDIYGGTSVISGITFSGTTATVTTTSPDGLAVGSKVTISGATPSVYDGSFSVTSIIDATDFTVTLTSTPGSSASGTDMSAVASQQVPIVSIIHSGTTATATTGGTHGLTAGSSITIQGASDPTYDGTFTVATIVNSTQFTYTLPSTPAANAVGVDMVAIVSGTATLDSTISRLTGMQDHVDGNILESYQYLGASTIAQKNRPQPGVDLSYIQQTGATGDGGDKYTGLDRFGRVDDQNWVNPSTGAVTDRFQYGYDRNSNVLYRNNLVNTSFGELYHTSAGSDQTGYDPLNRLTAFSRGTLVASGTNGTTLDSITGTPKATNAWTLDALGNPTTTGGASQNFNPQDQITSITGKTTPIYDANGNMTRDEAGHTYIYDAWNRMVSAYNGTNAETIIYDADNRRPGLNICGTTVTDSYYTTSWQDIEDDVVTLGCGGSTTKSTYVWSESYIDDVVARDQSVNSNPVTRVYAEQDANHDTTSLVNASGTALERFIYDPYGTRTVLNASSWSTGGDSQSWVFGYQGGRLDLTSGKINFRHRDLDTVTDTWMEKDPEGYAPGANPYQDDNSDPVCLSDPLGENVKPSYLINAPDSAQPPPPGGYGPEGLMTRVDPGPQLNAVQPPTTGDIAAQYAKEAVNAVNNNTSAILNLPATIINNQIYDWKTHFRHPLFQDRSKMCQVPLLTSQFKTMDYNADPKADEHVETMTKVVGAGESALGGYLLFRGLTAANAANIATTSAMGAAESGAVTQSIGGLRAAGLRDAHHVIQDAAVRDLPGYDTNAAPGVQLQGPSTAVGTPHYLATQVQRLAGGGTYGAECRIGYDALRAAGYSEAAAAQALREVDNYFRSLGVSDNTPTRIPGNR